MNLLELVLMVLCIKTRIVGREIVNKIEMNMDDEFDVELSCECVRGLDCEWRDGGSAIRCDDGRVSSCAADGRDGRIDILFLNGNLIWIFVRFQLTVERPRGLCSAWQQQPNQKTDIRYRYNEYFHAFI
eukprot:5770_1